jgi:hypothetical protein
MRIIKISKQQLNRLNKLQGNEKFYELAKYNSIQDKSRYTLQYQLQMQKLQEEYNNLINLCTA